MRSIKLLRTNSILLESLPRHTDYRNVVCVQDTTTVHVSRSQEDMLIPDELSKAQCSMGKGVPDACFSELVGVYLGEGVQRRLGHRVRANFRDATVRSN